MLSFEQNSILFISRSESQKQNSVPLLLLAFEFDQ